MDLLTDPYLDELRAMSKYIDETFAWLDHVYPRAAPFVPLLSPDAGADVAVGGTIEGAK